MNAGHLQTFAKASKNPLLMTLAAIIAVFLVYDGEGNRRGE